jgi:hypothetical protein
MNPEKTLYNVVCNVPWCLSFLLSIEFLFPLQENDSSPSEGLWLKTNHIVWLEKFPFTLWLHNSLRTKPLLSSPSSLHSKTLLVHLWVHIKPLIMTFVIAFKTLLLPTCDCTSRPYLWTPYIKNYYYFYIQEPKIYPRKV